MKEVPVPFVRTNQFGIVLFVAAAMLLQAPAWIAALWAVQVLTLWRGVQANLFVQLAAPLLKNRLAGAQTESRELQRFNNSIAVILLTLSLIGFWLDRDGWTGYVFAGFVALAALVALLGFCVGCFMYYQWKRLRR
ncbi:DUF4395 domain-containing protein [Paenibacillus puerhi]|uniref:DUF4395 domain-containing protein n=1 Tax=Paenibacillus puerhi TaxID=2692622 RepID=UPI00135ABCAA|nr:DUF4395 domain-containing protein [Paenibacillus puerhi]